MKTNKTELNQDNFYFIETEELKIILEEAGNFKVPYFTPGQKEQIKNLLKTNEIYI